jgi:hypothetical protein
VLPSRQLDQISTQGIDIYRKGVAKEAPGMWKKPLIGSLVLTLLLSAGLCLAQAPRKIWFPYMSDYYRDLRRVERQSQLQREIYRLREKQMSIELKQQIRGLRDRQMTRYPK